jgi:hypothetical protein
MVQVGLESLHKKRAELIQLREGLNLRYNQVLGQIEMIDAILAGELKPKEETKAVEKK